MTKNLQNDAESNSQNRLEELKNKITPKNDIVSKYSERRCMYYWSKLYANNSKKGNDYEKLNKVICIWILEDKVYDEFEDFISKWKMFNEEHGVGGHFGDIEFRIIELKKYRESATIKKNVRDFWFAFIDHKNEEMVKMACVTNEQIKRREKN